MRGQPSHGRTAKIAVIAGDGIGPEVIEAAIPILDRAAAKHGFALQWERLQYSADHYLRTKETLPDAAFRHLRDDTDAILDRKSTRLNSSHGYISYAVFCLKKKKRIRVG